jgi:peptidyl-prolyl cis-trans isomerase A (cyclophilin A)
MSANNIESDRKRSRPVSQKRKTDIFKKNRFVATIFIIVVIIAVIASAYLIIQNLPDDDDNGDTNGVEINPIAVFDTSLGTFKIELYEDKVPITAGNFVKLVNDGFYDGMTFYRISDNFMIQAGRYFPDGSEQFSPYGTIEFETHEDVKHVDGAISMASTGAGVGGSNEFFICDGEQSFLDGNYAPFGVVVDGIEVVRNIAAQPHDSSNPAGGGVPFEDIIIKSIIIESQ